MEKWDKGIRGMFLAATFGILVGSLLMDKDISTTDIISIVLVGVFHGARSTIAWWAGYEKRKEDERTFGEEP